MTTKRCQHCGRLFVAQRIQRQPGGYLAIVQTRERYCEACKSAKKPALLYQQRWLEKRRQAKKAANE